MTIRDLPNALRHGRKFKSERELLGWIITRLQDPSRRDLEFGGLTEYQDALLETSIGYIRAQTSWAKGIHVLSGTKDPDSGIPIVRSLLELWADFKYLYEPGQTDRVKRLRIWGTLILMNRRQPTQAMQEVADHLRAADPELYASVERQYKANSMGHYSGKGRKRLIVELCGEIFGRLYENLSWDVHPISQGLADIRVEEIGDTLNRRFTYRRPRNKVAADICLIPAIVLRDCWSQFVTTFGSPGSPKRRGRAGRR